MARTVKPEDAQVRLAIRTDHDANPEQTYKDLQAKFDVTYGTVILAMKRTADEWRVLLDASAARPAKPRADTPIPLPRLQSSLGISDVAIPPAATIQAEPRPITWDYKAIVIRGKADQGAPAYAFQDKGSVAWQSLANPSFDDVLSLFGKDGWELVTMTALSHDSQPFTGLFEIVFKRPH
jgi:hypothetical protein